MGGNGVRGDVIGLLKPIITGERNSDGSGVVVEGDFDDSVILVGCR